MFFTEFYAEFSNKYAAAGVNSVVAHQTVNIFVNQNALFRGYVGSEILPIGNNPFLPSDFPSLLYAEVDPTSMLLYTNVTLFYENGTSQSTPCAINTASP